MSERLFKGDWLVQKLFSMWMSRKKLSKFFSNPVISFIFSAFVQMSVPKCVQAEYEKKWKIQSFRRSKNPRVLERLFTRRCRSKDLCDQSKVSWIDQYSQRFVDVLPWTRSYRRYVQQFDGIRSLFKSNARSIYSRIFTLGKDI